MSALDQMPEGLTPKHRELAALLLSTPEGVTRKQAEWKLGIKQDRVFRRLASEITASGWLPLIVDRSKPGEGRYRIARADEGQRVEEADQEDYSRAVSLHKRARGRAKAFRDFHHAGSLFVTDVPDLEGAA